MTRIVRINRDRLWATLMELRQIGAYDDEATGLRGVRRLALTDADARARRRCVDWMRQAGLEVRRHQPHSARVFQPRGLRQRHRRAGQRGPAPGRPALTAAAYQAFMQGVPWVSAELQADLLIHLPESGVLQGSSAPAQTGAHKVAVGKTLFIAAVCAIIPLIGNVVASFLTTWTGVGSWLVVPVVGVVVAMLAALIQAYGSAPADPPPPGRYPPYAPYPPHSPYPPPHSPYPPPYSPYPPRRVSSRRTPLWRALLIVFLVIGVGGLAATEGVRYAVGYITGNEPGTSRLAESTSATSGGLTLTVESVEYTSHFTRVGVAARNETGTALALPLFDNCVFTGNEGTTLQADPFRSRWSDTLAPGSFQRGVIIFSGHLPDLVLQASLSFSNVFGPGGGSITVHSISLTPG